MLRLGLLLLILSTSVYSQANQKPDQLLKIDHSFDALSLNDKGQVTKRNRKVNAGPNRFVRILELKSHRGLPGYVIQINEGGVNQPEKYWVSKKWLDRALVEAVKLFGELEKVISSFTDGKTIVMCESEAEAEAEAKTESTPLVTLGQTQEADVVPIIRQPATVDQTSEAEVPSSESADCQFAGFSIGNVSMNSSRLAETTPQIYSKGYTFLEKIEALINSPSLSCEEKLVQMNSLSRTVSVEHVDDLVILDYIKNNLQSFLTDPGLRALLAATMKRRTVYGTIFCENQKKNCDANAPGMVILSNALIKKEVETIQGMGKNDVSDFSKLSKEEQGRFITGLSSHLGTLISDKQTAQQESEAFARECDKKVSRAFGKGDVHCTVSGYSLQRDMRIAPDGTYFLGGYDTAIDGRWHCYPSQQGTYNIDAELKIPPGGETRNSLGCYSGQKFKISVAHERRVGGKILFGGKGGSLRSEGGNGLNLHTHLELVLLPMTQQKKGEEYDEWWQSQKKIDPVNLFCRGTCGGK
ncbi:MAG TPA: hypothetical protein VNJ01_06560 [Bacteriovoracaceae bacterium]|nr:hypothetical protein [Bacteriovoracaceae bacterium]